MWFLNTCNTDGFPTEGLGLYRGVGLDHGAGPGISGG